MAIARPIRTGVEVNGVPVPPRMPITPVRIDDPTVADRARLAPTVAPMPGEAIIKVDATAPISGPQATIGPAVGAIVGFVIRVVISVVGFVVVARTLEKEVKSTAKDTLFNPGFLIGAFVVAVLFLRSGRSFTRG